MMHILFLITLFSYAHATQASVAALIDSSEETESLECAICLSDITSKEEFDFFECAHNENSFHKDCIMEFFNHTPNGVCPICRAKKTPQKPKTINIEETPFDAATLIGLATLENLDRKSKRRSSHQEKPKNKPKQKKGPSQSPQPKKPSRYADREKVLYDELEAFKVD